MKQFRSFSTILIALMLLASCEDYPKQFDIEIDTEIELSPSFVAPIAFGSLSLEDVLSQLDSSGFVELTEDSLLYIYYIDTAYSVKANELLELPNSVTNETYFESDINIPGWVSLPVGEKLTFYKQELIEFELEDDDRLDSVVLSEGDLRLIVNSEFWHTGVLTISSSNIFDPSGDSLIQTMNVGYVDQDFSDTKDFELDGYSFEVFEEGGMNVVKINFALELTKSSNPVSVGERCNLEVDLQNMEFSHLYGFISEREVLNEQQEMELPINDVLAEITAISFKDPQLNLYVHNSYGISASLDMTQSRIRSALDDNYYDFDFYSGFPFQIGAPTIDEVGETVSTILAINNTTSNITEIIDRAPNLVEFGVVATTGSSPGGGQSFVLDTSSLLLETELVLPMWLKVTDYEFSDTIVFDLGESLEGFDFLDTIAIKLKTINQLPIELDIQAYFLDEQYTILDSLIKTDNNRLIDGAPVDAEGKLDRVLLAEQGEHEFVLGLSGDQISAVIDTKHLLLKVINASTSGTDYVKFFSFYELLYRLSVEADFQINTSELSSDTE